MCACAFLPWVFADASAGDFKIEGSITGELRYFPDGPAYGNPDGPLFQGNRVKKRVTI